MSIMEKFMSIMEKFMSIMEKFMSIIEKFMIIIEKLTFHEIILFLFHEKILLYEIFCLCF